MSTSDEALRQVQWTFPDCERPRRVYDGRSRTLVRDVRVRRADRADSMPPVTTPSPAAPAIPRLLWSVVDQSLDVLYRRFDVVSLGDMQAYESATNAGIGTNDWFVAGEGWYTFLSGGSGHFPQIAMEAWTSKPPPHSPDWACVDESLARFTSEALSIVGMTIGASAGPSMTLPYSEANWFGVRLHVTPDPRLEAVDDLLMDIDDPQTDVLERWLLQIWPA